MKSKKNIKNSIDVSKNKLENIIIPNFNTLSITELRKLINDSLEHISINDYINLEIELKKISIELQKLEFEKSKSIYLKEISENLKRFKECE